MALNKDEYLKLFPSDDKEVNSIKEALKTALDTRKFEIELYWKRATYFWAFIAATIAGYFVLINSDNISEHKWFTILVALLGLFFSIGWYFVNRGSKFWQENWEMHVAYLEEKIQGPLFSLIWCSDDKLYQINKGYPFSVSKINQLLSFVVVLFWMVLFIYSISFTFEKAIYINDLNDISITLSTILLILLALVGMILFKYFSNSFMVKMRKGEKELPGFIYKK